MSFIVDTLNDEVRLEGDGFGASSEMKELQSAPAGTKKMQFAWRCHIDNPTPTGTQNIDGLGWNHTNYFGLGFDDSLLKFPVPYSSSDVYSPNGFFGILNRVPLTLTSSSTFPPTATPDYDRVGYEAVSDAYNSSFKHFAFCCSDNSTSKAFFSSFMNGVGGAFENVWRINYGTLSPDPSQIVIFPYTEAAADYFTAGWEVWASAVDKTMYAAFYIHLSTSAPHSLDNLLNVFTTYTHRRQYTIHGDVTSLWRSDFATVNFPTWLKFRYSLPAFKMIFKRAMIQYMGYDEAILGAETLP